MSRRTPHVTAVILAAAAVLAAGSALSPGAADARVRGIAIDPLSRELSSGLRLVVTGRIQCDRGETMGIWVHVTQRAGAWGRARFAGRCLGRRQRWIVVVHRAGPARFVTGAARGCSLEFTVSAGRGTDAHQACRVLRVV